MVTHPMAPGTYTVTSGYGPRWGTFHAGLDFAAPTGTPIYAAADGVVVQGADRPQGSVQGFGSWIWLDCQNSVGRDFIYGHVHHPGIKVRAGDRVRAGQQIGVVGNEGQSTGPHLHFEVWGAPGRQGGKHQDPAHYLRGATPPDDQKKENPQMATVIDFSAGIIPAKQVRDAGHIGSIRYISPPREAWMRGKPATPAEIADYKANALDTAFVWQYGAGTPTTSDVMRGRPGGLEDARNADAKLREIKRTGYPVFFAVDFDITIQQWNDTAVHYFRAAAEVLGRERVGIYGHSRVCDWARQDGVIGAAGGGKWLMWQTSSWAQPRGHIHPGAVLYQHTHNVPGPGGMRIDINDVRHTYWGQHPPRPDQAQDQPVTDPQPAAPEAPSGPAPKPTEQFKADRDLLTWRDNGIARRPRIGIGIHTDESAYNYATGQMRDGAWTADQLAEYNRRRDISGGSYHLGIDRDGRTVRQNDDVYGTWSVGSVGNDLLFHVCLTGTAYQTREQWLTLGAKQLDKLADVLAHYCRFHDIPATRISPADLRAGRKGILGHWDCSKHWGGSDHWDPGGYDGTTGVPKTAGGFPWDHVIQLTRQRVDAATKPAPAPAPEPEKEKPVDVIHQDRIQSLINPEVYLSVGHWRQLQDAYAWENRAALRGLYEALGLDYDQTIADAIAADRGTAA